MIKKLSFSLLLAALVTPVFTQQNVVLIIADDLGTDYLGFYDDGLDTANMPNVRSLLAGGVRFKRAWSFPYCSEIRAAVLTGRYPFRTGVGTVIASPTDVQLDTSEISIGKVIKSSPSSHYAVANIGKWHLHAQNQATRNYPAVMGFDHYSGNFSGALPDYWDWKKIVDGAPAVNVTNYATTEQTDDALAWLNSLPPGKPFFLWQAFNAPHSPYHLPPAGLHSVPGLTGTPQHIQQNQSEYFKAMVEAMDTEIGRLLQWLDDHQLRDSTNIIFIGDNGTAPNVCQCPDPQRAKGTVYEPGVHVPMLISGPAVTAPGRTSDALVSTADLFATILEMAGVSAWATQIPATKPVDAVSLLPILKNETTTVRDWVFTEVFSTTASTDDAKAVRDTDFKLIRFDDGHEEFYKITADPDELNNLLLQLPLSAEALARYQFLCNAMANLLGTPNCSPSVGVEHLNDFGDAISVFPNPTAGNVLLNFNKLNLLGTFQAQVFDAGGSLVFQKENAGSALEIGGLARGVYFLKIKFEKGEINRKIIVH
ncbi:MAG: sulfatase-like hydrolase/transferase [Saprospiraceae bacterium]|nr:sulfatase-like hydrolase/transferase [Saprospiraceae bacterium]